MTARISLGDQVQIAWQGLTARRGRTLLSALGISIGIAALVAVLGLSESSRADLVAQLDQLGTDLLEVEPGQSAFGADAALPAESPPMLARIEGVEQSAAVYAVDGAVRRTDLTPEAETGGISLFAADDALLGTVSATLAQGRWLAGIPSDLPAVVLGATAAERLGISDLAGTRAVWIDDRWFEVVGILRPATLAEQMDEAALIGFDAAIAIAGETPSPSRVYVRAEESRVDEVRSLLAPTANPAAPGEVAVSRPSDALVAAVAAKGTFTSLFLGLGSVVLLVGTIGVANVMVISVMERRREIGVRRALGATRTAVSRQFLTEALLLSGAGGALGVVIGAVVTVGFSVVEGWHPQLPGVLLGGALLISVLVGGVAGIYPAARAAGIPPTEALRSV